MVIVVIIVGNASVVLDDLECAWISRIGDGYQWFLWFMVIMAISGFLWLAQAVHGLQGLEMVTSGFYVYRRRTLSHRPARQYTGKQ